MTTTAAVVPVHVTAGRGYHGVALLARQIAGVLSAPVAAPDADAAPAGPRHLHFSDHAWGATAAEAVARVEALAAHGPFTVTLHDLPHPSEGSRRAEAYRRVAALAAGVICSSEHEARLLEECAPQARPHVIPLPLDVAAAPVARPAPDGMLAVLGWIYPGKGHEEAIDAAAAVGATGVLALGATSPGHDDLARALSARASARDVAFNVTGALDDAAMLDACRRVAVPIAAHRRISASGSINSWIAAGRRPLVRASRYAEEIAAMRPGTVTTFEPPALVAAVRRAFEEPGTTWWDAGTPLGPDLAEVAARYLAWWTDEVAW